jgi:small-conductance mechanosensitive channel
MNNWMDILTSNSASAWLAAGIVFVSVIVAILLARFIAAKYLSAFAAKTQTRIDDITLLLLKKIKLLLVIVVAIYFGQKMLEVPDKLTVLLRAFAVSAAFLQIALWGNALISFYLAEGAKRTGEHELNVSARRAIGYLSRLVLWLLIVALLLENLGVRLTPLLTGIGIGGVAVALAVQNILGDLFCYVAIILDKPFIAGDFIIVNDLMGSVERIGLKTTRVRSLSGEMLVFANHDLVNSRIRNYKTLQERRVVFRFGVTYDTPTEKLRRIPDTVRSIFGTLHNVRLDRVHFAQLGDFSLNYEVVYYVLSGDYNVYMDTQQAVNLSLMDEIGKEDVEFAFPTQSLYVNAVQPTND